MWIPLLLFVAVATAQNPDQCPPIPDNVQVSMDMNGCPIYTVTCPAGNTVSTMGPSTPSSSPQSSESSTLSSETSTISSTPSTSAVPGSSSSTEASESTSSAPPSPTTSQNASSSNPGSSTISSSVVPGSTTTPAGSSTVAPGETTPTEPESASSSTPGSSTGSSSVVPGSTTTPTGSSTVAPGETTTAPVNPPSSTTTGSSSTIEGSAKTGEEGSTTASGAQTTPIGTANATSTTAPVSGSPTTSATGSNATTTAASSSTVSTSPVNATSTAAPGSTSSPAAGSPSTTINGTSSTPASPSSSTIEGTNTTSTTMGSTTTTSMSTSTTTTAISVPPGCTIPDAPAGCILMKLEEVDANGCPTFTAICLPEVCDVDTCPTSMICKEKKEVCLEEPCPPPFTCLDNAVRLRYLDEMVVPLGFSLNGVKFGGNVGLAYSREDDYFYVLRLGSEQLPPSFMTLKMRIDETGFCTLEIMVPLTILTNGNGIPFDTATVRPSSIVFIKNHLIWSSQKEEGVGAPHSIRRMGLDGVEMERFPIPQSHVPQFDENNTQIVGVQKGFGFGGLSWIPGSLTMFAFNKGPLAQDVLENSDVQFVRATGYQLQNFTSEANSTRGTPGNFSSIFVEFLWPMDPPPMGFLTRVVADFVCLDERRAIVMETATDLDRTQFRSYLYLLEVFDMTFNNETNETTRTFDATPVTGVFSIRDLVVDGVNGPVFPMRKTFLQEISDRTLDLSKGMDLFENLEEGKPLEDGRRVLISGTNDENMLKRVSTSITWTFDKIVGEQDQF